jgi:hypothetical protein
MKAIAIFMIFSVLSIFSMAQETNFHTLPENTSQQLLPFFFTTPSKNLFQFGLRISRFGLVIRRFSSFVVPWATAKAYF